MQKSAFVRVFGESPTVKILDFLLSEGRSFDYTMKEIAKNSDVSWGVFAKVFKRLKELGIVKPTRKIARATFYMLDENNILVQNLIELDNKISSEFIEKELEEQKSGHLVKADL